MSPAGSGRSKRRRGARAAAVPGARRPRRPRRPRRARPPPRPITTHNSHPSPPRAGSQSPRAAPAPLGSCPGRSRRRARCAWKEFRHRRRRMGRGWGLGRRRAGGGGSAPTFGDLHAKPTPPPPPSPPVQNAPDSATMAGGAGSGPEGGGGASGGPPGADAAKEAMVGGRGAVGGTRRRERRSPGRPGGEGGGERPRGVCRGGGPTRRLARARGEPATGPTAPPARWRPPCALAARGYGRRQSPRAVRRTVAATVRREPRACRRTSFSRRDPDRSRPPTRQHGIVVAARRRPGIARRAALGPAVCARARARRARDPPCPPPAHAPTPDQRLQRANPTTGRRGRRAALARDWARGLGGGAPRKNAGPRPARRHSRQAPCGVRARSTACRARPGAGLRVCARGRPDADAPLPAHTPSPPARPARRRCTRARHAGGICAAVCARRCPARDAHRPRARPSPPAPPPGRRRDGGRHPRSPRAGPRRRRAQRPVARGHPPLRPHPTQPVYHRCVCGVVAGPAAWRARAGRPQTNFSRAFVARVRPARHQCQRHGPRL